MEYTVESNTSHIPARKRQLLHIRRSFIQGRNWNKSRVGKIFIEKNIPSGRGCLAWLVGSTDAAAVL
jgi:4-diphosphocytidyl-2C-methyl-D-erythritol kinase